MRIIGGEIEQQENFNKSFFTDSGRSSLRLFLRTDNNSSKSFLIPNFFCSVIEDLLIEESVNYSFYDVKNDFTIDSEQINKQKFDVFYSINYFGKLINLNLLKLEDKILVEDNVFLTNFHNHNHAKKWFAFNSYRKISELTDGSLIKTNLNINKSLIINNQADFVEIKKKAKNIKYKFIYNSKYSEQNYLDLFKEGETTIDKQTEIYTISNTSLNLLFNKGKQQLIETRFNKLKQLIEPNYTNKEHTHFSFFTFNCENKLSFIQAMKSENIFLPNFWPKTSQDNSLYDTLISIPLFHNYNDIEFNYMLEIITKHLKL